MSFWEAQALVLRRWFGISQKVQSESGWWIYRDWGGKRGPVREVF